MRAWHANNYRPANPKQIGQYTPDQADVWGVFVDRNYVLASDMAQGLKVLVKNNGQSAKNLEH